jgi:hypothetical protein
METLGYVVFVVACYGAYRVEVWAAARRSRKGMR